MRAALVYDGAGVLGCIKGHARVGLHVVLAGGDVGGDIPRTTTDDEVVGVLVLVILGTGGGNYVLAFRQRCDAALVVLIDGDVAHVQTAVDALGRAACDVPEDVELYLVVPRLAYLAEGTPNGVAVERHGG